eukprot:TRINITY_DN9548_c0_g1_i1.p1 TRINITY_DN9548_c0_g1~~TRINITY_DN9548_c0_g1_i1.p1  ORF type:complete len:446 (+),score=115.94 TRINITY_DN9548_c0_g1_i1:74-1411(+)
MPTAYADAQGTPRPYDGDFFFPAEADSLRALSCGEVHRSPVREGAEPELARFYGRWAASGPWTERLLSHIEWMAQEASRQQLLARYYGRWRVWVERYRVMQPPRACLEGGVPPAAYVMSIEELKSAVAEHTGAAAAHTAAAENYSGCAARLRALLRARLQAEMEDLDEEVHAEDAHGTPPQEGLHEGLRAPSVTTSATLPSWCGTMREEFTVPMPGYISRGGDLLKRPKWLRVEDAQRVARADPACLGFTFHTKRRTADGKVPVHFKKKCEVVGREATGAKAGWVSYLRFNALIDGGAQGVQMDSTFRQVGRAVADAISDVATDDSACLPPSREGSDGGEAGVEEEEEAMPDARLRQRGLSPTLRRRLIRMYTRYNPAKLPSVVPTLAEFAGHEPALFAALIAQYGPEPVGAEPPRAPGWYPIESVSGDLFYKHEDGRKQWQRPV